MKIIAAGDLHIRSSNPENRIDNYEETLWGKVRFILEVSQGYPILFPGDVFDHPIQSNAVLSKYVSFIRNGYACFGQHDLKYRTAGNTALDVLNAGGGVRIVQNGSPLPLANNILIYGCSFNEEIPEIKDEKAFTILLIHKMIIEEKIWEGQTDYTWANVLLRITKFDLVISGDNHKGFIIPYKNRLLVNCGSLMRSAKDQFNHKPFIVIYDTDTRKYEKVFIPIRPAAEVFDMEKIEREEEKNEKLEAFILGLSEHREIGLDFQKSLFSYMKENAIDEEIQKIVKENF